MKKNVMMRIASVLLIAVLISTCGISGTYAKYVTSDSGTDNARVAKWGVTITPNGAMFEKQYATDDTMTYTGDHSVITSDEWKVLAPGTTHDMTSVVLTGVPEVATKVTYTATINLTNWTLEDNTTSYCPVYFTVEGKTIGIEADCGKADLDVKCTDVADLAVKLKTAIDACTAVYAPKTNFATQVNYPNVTWTWPFYSNDANDVKDTVLGNLTANGRASVIEITIATTVEQVD